MKMQDYPKYMVPKEMMRLEQEVYEKYHKGFSITSLKRKGGILTVQVKLEDGRTVSVEV